MQQMTVEDAKRQLIAHLEKAMTYVDMADEPIEKDDTPSPCFDDPSEAPDMGKAQVDYVVLVEPGTSYEAARKVEAGLEGDGWTISRNTGAPDDQWMFSATKGDYGLFVSGSKGEVGSILIGGSSACLPKGDAGG